MKYFIFGHKGFIGSQIQGILRGANQCVVHTDERIETQEIIHSILSKEKPHYVVCCIGRKKATGIPSDVSANIDSLEEPKEYPSLMLSNVYVPIWIANVTKQLGIPMLYIGTGCIYEYSGLAHSVGGAPFTELDAPNFFGSAYSRSKIITDTLLKSYDHVINARIRMPIVDVPQTLTEEASDFICKLVKYSKIYSVPNSMTVLSDVLPMLLACLHDKRLIGTVNAVNDGVIDHKTILDSYSMLVDPSMPAKEYVTTESTLQLKASRSNNHLDCTLLNQTLQKVSEHTRRLFGIPDTVPTLRDSILKVLSKRKPKRILVTGGYGFIGSHFVNMLLQQSDVEHVSNVDILDVCAKKTNVDLSKAHGSTTYAWYENDIASEHFETRFYEILMQDRITHIVHFAAKTHVDESFEKSLEYTRTNVLGTHKLLEGSRRYMEECPMALQCFLHISTDEVYGQTLDLAAHETSLLKPTNPYAATKVGAESLVTAYGSSFQFPWKMVRCNNVYGPNQYEEKVVPKFFKLAQDGLPLTIHGNGQARRHFVHVSDVVEAVYLVLQNGQRHEIYNVGSQDELTIEQLAECILKLTNSKSQLVYVKDRLFNDQRYFVNYDKLKQLGWCPKISLQDGLAAMK